MLNKEQVTGFLFHQKEVLYHREMFSYESIKGPFIKVYEALDKLREIMVYLKGRDKHIDRLREASYGISKQELIDALYALKHALRPYDSDTVILERILDENFEEVTLTMSELFGLMFRLEQFISYLEK